MPRLRRRALARTERDPLAELLAGKTGAARAIAFIEHLTHGKGEQAGRPFLLEPFQRRIVEDLFGTLDDIGRRRYREALLMLPRKQGKTTLAAALGLFGTYCGEMGGQVVCAATSRDQAGLLFGAAADFVEASPILRARSVISRPKKTIKDSATNSTFRALSADAPTAHGLDLNMWIYDELHAAPNGELYDVLRTATGARQQPLGIVISTAGYDKLSPLGRLYEHAKRVLTDPAIDPSFYAAIFEADPGDDWTAESTWRKANPALGVFRSLEEMRQACERAKQIPAQAEAFRRLYLNRWGAAETRWLEMSEWDACGASIPDEELAEYPAYGGLDLSATTDLTAFVLAWPVGELIAVRPWFWIPEDGIRERERRDRVPYREWIEKGFVETTPGAAIDQRFIARRVAQICGNWTVRMIGYDRWGAAAVEQDLRAEGLEVVEIRMGYSGLSAPTKELQRRTLRHQIRHGGNPVLRWNLDSLTVTQDPMGNIRPVKVDRLKSNRRIDGAVALILGLDCLTRSEGPELDGEFFARGVLAG